MSYKPKRNAEVVDVTPELYAQKTKQTEKRGRCLAMSQFPPTQLCKNGCKNFGCADAKSWDNLQPLGRKQSTKLIKKKRAREKEREGEREREGKATLHCTTQAMKLGYLLAVRMQYLHIIPNSKALQAFADTAKGHTILTIRVMKFP